MYHILCHVLCHLLCLVKPEAHDTRISFGQLEEIRRKISMQRSLLYTSVQFIYKLYFIYII